jgi:RHS repeat-associated protein
VDRSYDPRNRLTALSFPDGNGNQTWTYTADGLPASITTANDGGATSVINTYSYNRRRLLVAETLTQPGWYSWGLGYGYDRNGHLASHGYPGGEAVSYAPNALGQATQVASQFATYASGASYYPNGALKQFTYGNGLLHTMTQNARQLPQRSTDSGGVLDYQYVYDGNANVQYLYDWVNPALHRYLYYDGLDRLTDAGSQAFGGDHWHRFTYDALDNLKSWKLGGVKDHAEYVYDPSNRLTNIRNSAGATIVGLGYDVQGNLANKNGQTYAFDYGNRLRHASPNGSEVEAYRYDGHGRRVLAWHSLLGNILSQYGQDGVLRYQHDFRKNKVFNYQYLAGSLVAIRETPMGTANHAYRYQHTDALGSPVAVTNEAGQVIDRTQWEPFGAAIGKPAYDGVGYTGHVMDGATGLTYMQQRYYDPAIGRFLSVDPVTADGNTGANFNRYWYGNNNPYKFRDPDGRLACDGNANCREQIRELEQRGIFPLQAKGSGSPSKGNARSSDRQTLESGDLAGFWKSKEGKSNWADIGKGMWSPETASPKFRLLGQLAKGSLFMNMAIRDGGAMPFMHSVEAGFIGKEIASGMSNFMATTGRDPGLHVSNQIHNDVFRGHGLPSSTYGGTPLGYAPTGRWNTFGNAQSEVVNAVVGYCERCDP